MESYITQKELSNILGITTRRIRELRQTEGILVADDEKKKYNLPVCVREFIQYKIQCESGSKNADYEKERAEHEKVKKEIAKLKLRKIRGELHEATDVEIVITDMLVSFRSKLTSIPTKLAPGLLGKSDANEVVKVLKNEINECLEELSSYNPEDYIMDVRDIESDSNESEDDEPDPENMP